MDAVFIVGILWIVIYKIFELFVGRRERIMVIDKLTPEGLKEKLLHNNMNLIGGSYSVLRLGCLAIGVGLGLLLGFFLEVSMRSGQARVYIDDMDTLVSIIYGASVLLCGGIGLLAAWIVEIVRERKSNDRRV
ncbi:DUF6249 domain-containing protein [Bacteroides ilei]|uniref:DUF6249 domain-containing protein n=1 Tax=Bacteroides ilei TaxID=1907658 RepID=UPI0009F854ED|nr:DUF6249 domain-containing protein [Bacteroides ilei]